ncbi:hypothetical protein AGMMS49543_10370 [Betaproteobacteria bacterium]|nr:hypothetical protein AGMMS49543_10370 [Betaproteobacteria bacterium]GHU11001.1 hypothetical protein AGMMS50225_15580 [Betaproteobacteria bacterium]GHU20124.1 hypothetical protein AGMMS50243_13840 [Betaproteobacteria bacterium]
MKRGAGFSLIEILIALAIMAMALGALYRTAGGAVRGVAEAGQRNRATALAMSLLDTHDNIPSRGIRDAGHDAGMDWSLVSSPYLEAAAPGWPLHRVEVTVSWNEGRRSLTLASLLPQRHQALESVR